MALATLRRNLGQQVRQRTSAREVHVRVRGGYDPGTIHAEVGVRLRLIFRREETSPCSEQVVFPSFGKSATLPPGEQVAVELLPDEPGEHEFTCAMGMLHGRLIVERAP
jgi:plastocyanin domain-containing protein